MNNLWSHYSMIILGEIIGAKEFLSKENRYRSLSRNLKILSERKTDEEIIVFFKKRAIIYKQIKVFSGFFVSFLILMSYTLSGSFLFTLGVSLVLLVVYGVLAVTIKAERNYSYLWDNETLFLHFIKLNKSSVFVPQNFDELNPLNSKVDVVEDTLSFEEECMLLSKQKNAFNGLEMEVVIRFFKIMVLDDSQPDQLQKVIIRSEDFIRFIKARFIDNSDEYLHIKLERGDKSHIKALVHKFYTFGCEFYGQRKKGEAKQYIDLYLLSFSIFDKQDYTNFNDGLALDYSQAISQYLNIDK